MLFSTLRALTSVVLTGLVLLTTLRPTQAQVDLSGTVYTENFNNLSAGLPAGWTVRTGATTTNLGTSVSLVTAQTSWASTTGNFRNVASANVLSSTTTAGGQNASTDRALAVRQTGGFGDPGAAFVLQLTNTANLQDFALAFKLQSLDAGAPRRVTWRVDYSIGVTPTTFTDAGASGTLITGESTFSNQTITADFGSSLDNQGTPVWIRIVTAGASTGGGNRPTTGIDDVTLTYAPLSTTDPTLAANPTTLGSFTTTQGTPSAVQTYTVTGSNLVSDVRVQATDGFEVSLNGTDFALNQVITPTSTGTVSATVFVRLTGASVGRFGDAILNDGRQTTAVVRVDGQVFLPAGQFTPIATARGLPNNTLTTIAGRVTVSNQFGGRLFYIQDNTGGIAVFSGSGSAPLYGNQVQLGDSVQVSGPVDTFQGKKEINGVTSFTLVSGVAGRVPAPAVITPGQLAAYEGQLVQINQATIGGSGPNLAGSTNYPITASGQSAELRIDPNTALVGRGKPTTPVDIVGISDRFTSGATNILQLLPRTLDDLPTTEPVALDDQYCGGTGGSELTRDQTFDIAAWNVEFFGADAGSFTCTTGPTRTYDDLGPANEALQAQNVVKVFQKLTADVIVLEEVSNQALLSQAVSTSLSGYSLVCSDKFSYYFQDQCEQSYDANGTVFGPTSLAQKVCVLYKTSTVTPLLAESRALFDGRYPYPNADNWSSGRLPYLFVANVTVNGITKKLHIVGIHAKSGSATADYNRRKQDILDLKAELDQTYPNANVVVLGDYNDQILTSIASGQPSTYKPFDDDAANYTILTKPLEAQGCRTFQSGSFLDHITISNELQPAYVANTTTVLTPGIDNYNNTTSDHSPVFARFDLSKLDAAAPAITITPSSLSIANTGQNIGSNPRSYTVSGVNLTGDIYIEGPQPYILSQVGNPGNSGTPSVTLHPVNGVVPPTEISVALVTSTPGTYNGVITHTSGSASVDLPLYGTVTGSRLEVSPTALTNFTTTVGTPSASQSYTLTSLTERDGVITAPAGFEIRTGNAPFSSQILLGISFPQPAIYVVDVRLTGAAEGPVSGEVLQRHFNQSNPSFVRVAVSGTVLPAVSMSALTLTAPTYNCQTGAFTFNTAGGDGTTITYQAVGITGPTTNPNQFVDAGLRTAADAQPITLYATQSGVTVQYTFNIRAVCPVGPTPPASTSALQLTTPTYNCQTGAFTFNTTGGDGTTITYQAVGITGPTTNPNQFVDAGLRTAADAQPITLYATQSGMTAEYTFDIRAFCPVGPPNPPVSTSALTLTAPTYNCQTGAFAFNTSGGDGTPITYQAVGITGPTTNPNQFVDAGLRTAADAQPLTLYATQSGVTVQYTFDIRATCPVGARKGVVPAAESALQVRILGNPVQNGRVTVEVLGAADQPLTLSLTDSRGQALGLHPIERASLRERYTFELGRRSAGLLLLRAVTPTQSQTVRVLVVE